jgi:transcriptional regulator with XRE-family HTH domain
MARKSIHSPAQIKLQSLLKQLRLDADVRQEQLAAKLKRPQSFVSKYESGERRLDIIELRDVCAALGVSLEVFVSKLEKMLKN